MALKTPQDASLNLRRDATPYVKQRIALRTLTTDGSGVSVNFANTFRAWDGSAAAVIDLSGVVLRELRIANPDPSGTILYSLDGVTDGTNLIYQIIPSLNAVVLSGFDTSISLVLKDGTASGVVATLQAVFDAL